MKIRTVSLPALWLAIADGFLGVHPTTAQTLLVGTQISNSVSFGQVNPSGGPAATAPALGLNGTLKYWDGLSTSYDYSQVNFIAAPSTGQIAVGPDDVVTIVNRTIARYPNPGATLAEDQGRGPWGFILGRIDAEQSRISVTVAVEEPWQEQEVFVRILDETAQTMPVQISLGANPLSYSTSFKLSPPENFTSQTLIDSATLTPQLPASISASPARGFEVAADSAIPSNVLLHVQLFRFSTPTGVIASGRLPVTGSPSGLAIDCVTGPDGTRPATVGTLGKEKRCGATTV